ncbi:MAG: hypothetical protein ACI8QS_001113 [Planctomycetota bacterium]|jgi:hypothetical protein
MALTGVIALGLATRSHALPWPDFVASNCGDALWTVALYLAICFACPRWKATHVALQAASISVAVEFSQLLSLPWLATARETILGRLLLGTDFVWVDIPRYLTGAVVALLLELVWDPLRPGIED